MKKIKRIEEYRKLNMGFFIHFGLYNFIKSGEWYQKMNNLSNEEYLKLIGNLNEKDINLNFDDILVQANINGFKYCVLTAKHHEGFYLYDTKGKRKLDINLFKNKKDLISEFVNKCKKYNIKPIIYYGTLDWFWDEQNYSFDEKLKLINEDVSFICENYPDVKGFWFDGNWSVQADWKEHDLYKMIRNYNPEMIIINNSGLENTGKVQDYLCDSLTFEQGHLKEINYDLLERDLIAEVCESFNDHWGYSVKDFNYKSVSYLIEKFIDSKKIKANYLLNISIDDSGNMVSLEKETLNIFGKWVNLFGKIFYKNYEIISSNSNGSYIVKSLDDNKVAIYLKNIKSGGHINEIAYGSQEMNNLNFILPNNFKINNLKYLDNNKYIDFKIEKNKLILQLNSFDYGTNTVIRALEGEYNENN